MITKREKALELIKSGKEKDALKILGTIAFKKTEKDGQLVIEARDALINPSIYKQIGIDVDSLVLDGISAMRRILKI